MYILKFENCLSRNIFRKRKEEDSLRTKQTEVAGARKTDRKKRRSLRQKSG